MTGSERTIVTLDLQLYSKCIQLRERNEIKNNFIFRLGELLKVVGKYIEDSGLDRVFQQAGIYSKTTLDQIMDGGHYKRGIESYTTIYLALKSLHMKEIKNSNHDDGDDDWNKSVAEIYDIVKTLSPDGKLEDNQKVQQNIIDKINAADLPTKIANFNSGLKNQGLFMLNLLEMFEGILLFIRASRQGLWKLHLASLNNFTKHFFAFDQLNYARLSPYYLVTRMELEDVDPTSWKYLEENYTVVKNDIPFVGIGSGHALEQENKTLKISGGVIGITQNQNALNRFCLASSVMNGLSTEFCNRNGISSSKRKHHYQLDGSTQERIKTNFDKLLVSMEMFEVSFEQSENVFNVVSKRVLPVEESKEFLNHAEIGEKLYQKFVKERIQGDSSVWDPMKRNNLKTFKDNSKSIKTKVGEKMIEIKEEKNLMSRFLIAARKRPEMELEMCIGEYEFSVVPRSLFTPDGLPHTCNNKSQLIHLIEDYAEITDATLKPGKGSAIIIDGMAVVNQIVLDDNPNKKNKNKKKRIETCRVS